MILEVPSKSMILHEKHDGNLNAFCEMETIFMTGDINDTGTGQKERVSCPDYLIYFLSPLSILKQRTKTTENKKKISHSISRYITQ